MARLIRLLIAASLPVLGLPAGPQNTGRGVLADPGASRRTALVIGNDAYPGMPLKNAVNDAKAIATALKQYNFDVVLATDLSYKEMSKQIDRFIAQIRPDDVAMVYYAGHGVQLENENYLVPTDFAPQDEADARYEGYSANRLEDRLSGSQARLSILVMDACRNNPFRTSRSGTRGLAAMETGKGNLIAFATAPNQTADDNPRAGNGLFTSYVLEAMQQPGLTVEQVFSWARKKVYDASQGRQTPWLISSVIGDFYFRPPAAAGKPPDDETAMWVAISESESPAAFRQYLERYPSGRYARMATLYLKGLTLGGGSAPAPATGPDPAASSSSTIAAPAAVGLYFLKAQQNKTYVPFLVSLGATGAGARGTVGMYYRVESATGTSTKAAGPPKYPYEDYQETVVGSQPAPGQQLQASFSVPAGDYVLSVATAATGGKSSRDVIKSLLARVDSGDPAVLKMSVHVPDFWGAELTTSSVMLVSRIDPLTAQLTGGEQSARPFALGKVELHPETSRQFSTSQELSVFFLVYNPAISPATRKPDVTVDYAFYARPAGQPERYFNRTTPQRFSADTLPKEFDLAAGHQVQSGQAIPLKAFPPGEYRLQITVRDAVSGKQITRDATFSVR